MSFPRKLFYENADEARKFVVSQEGTILHEIGHYVAANSEDLVAGHCIVEHGTDQVSSAFVYHDNYGNEFLASTDRCAYTAAAGAVTELYFCNNTDIGRLGPDIIAYCKLLQKTPTDLTPQDVVSIWQHDYFLRIESIADSIVANYDRCVALCRSRRFLIGSHHVIPTCCLRPPCRRNLMSRFAEARETQPKPARERALERFLSGQFAGSS
jgi:hypothetical protein